MEEKPPRAKESKLTDENRRESAALKELYDKSSHGMSQAAFGDLYGIGNQGAVWQCLNARGMPISLKAAQGFSKGLNCEIADFSPRLAELAASIGKSVSQGDGEFEPVSRLTVQLSAGNGSVEGYEEELGVLQFRRDFLRSCGISNPAKAKVCSVVGYSMDPTIPDGSVVLINTNNREEQSGKIFALAKAHDGLVIKRLVNSAQGWLARSDNPDGNPDFLINDGEPVNIIGRAVWVGSKL